MTNVDTSGPNFRNEVSEYHVSLSFPASIESVELVPNAPSPASQISLLCLQEVEKKMMVVGYLGVYDAHPKANMLSGGRAACSAQQR
jgi:hypothetical protein